jgi:DNA-binding MarR family transcriptional regulator
MSDPNNDERVDIVSLSEQLRKAAAELIDESRQSRGRAAEIARRMRELTDKIARAVNEKKQD